MLAALASCQVVPPAGGSGSTAGRSLDLPLPDGSHRMVALEDRGAQARLGDGRHTRSLPFAAGHVIAFGALPDALVHEIEQSDDPLLTVSGSWRDGSFRPDGVDLLEPDAMMGSQGVATGVPLYDSLLSRLQGETFGAEQRASVDGAGVQGLELNCTAGAAPAGVQLRGHLGGTLDRRSAALRVRMRGNGSFPVLVADGARAVAEDPLAVGTLEPGSDWTRVDLPLPRADWQPGDWQSLTLACPDGAARLEIASLEVVLADHLPVPGSRALWVWTPTAWQQDGGGLIAHLRASGAREVFVSVPLADESCQGDGCMVAQPEQLAAFLGDAAAAGLKVWAVAGDPLAVLPEEREAWLGRARAYAQFNRGQPAGMRLAGVQYDIETYLLPGYDQAPEAWNARFLGLLADLRASADGMPLDVVVPWWFGQGGNSPPDLLAGLASRVDRLTVMDYRTDPAQVLQSALPFIEWGRRHDRPVRIAVESGPLPDLETRRYATAARGELWLVELGGQHLYLLLDAAFASDGSVRVFASRGGHLVRATQTTFYRRPEALWRMVARLEDEFAAAAGFAGVAIHGLDAAWY